MSVLSMALGPAAHGSLGKIVPPFLLTFTQHANTMIGVRRIERPR